VQDVALLVLLVIYRTTLMANLHFDAAAMPPKLRCEKLAVQGIIKLKDNSNNPARRCLFCSHCETLFEPQPDTIHPLGYEYRINFPTSACDWTALHDVWCRLFYVAPNDNNH
jgi:hypothetical protein